MSAVSSLIRPFIPLPPIVPPIGPVVSAGVDAAKASAEALIHQVDARAGKHVLDTPLESELLHHWIEGSGKTWTLSRSDMHALASTADARTVGRYIATHGASAAGGTVDFGHYSTTLQPVTLENGQPGYRADLDFNPDRKTTGNAFDGSIGRGRVYFDQAGHAVGVQDSYDFSNDSTFVDGINTVGASVGARNFELRGGMIERDSDLTVPSGPGLVSSAGSLAGRAIDKAEDAVGEVVHKAGDWVSRLPLPPFFGPFSF